MTSSFSWCKIKLIVLVVVVPIGSVQSRMVNTPTSMQYESWTVWFCPYFFKFSANMERAHLLRMFLESSPTSQFGCHWHRLLLLFQIRPRFRINEWESLKSSRCTNRNSVGDNEKVQRNLGFEVHSIILFLPILLSKKDHFICRNSIHWYPTLSFLVHVKGSSIDSLTLRASTASFLPKYRDLLVGQSDVNAARFKNSGCAGACKNRAKTVQKQGMQLQNISWSK